MNIEYEKITMCKLDVVIRKDLQELLEVGRSLLL